MDIINVKDIYFSIYEDEHIRKINMYKSKNDYQKIIEEYKQFADNISKLSNMKVKEWIEIKIDDYFDFVKINPSNIFKIDESEIGEYPLIYTKSDNNGIVRYIDSYSIDITDCITVAMNGSIGSCFYQSGKFGITNGIVVLKLKEGKTLDLKLFSALTTYFLTKKYNYTKNLTNKNLSEEIIYYPIVEFTD